MIETQVGECSNGGIIEKPSIERDVDMAYAGEASSTAGQRLG